jgi:hypothetical protein
MQTRVVGYVLTYLGTQDQDKVNTMLRPMVSRPICLGVKPIWGPRPDISYCQRVAGLLMCGAFSDESVGLSFTIVAGPTNGVILGSESRGTHDHILLFQIRDLPNLESQVHVFIFPRNRVAWLQRQALGSFWSPPTTRRAILGTTVRVRARI